MNKEEKSLIVNQLNILRDIYIDIIFKQLIISYLCFSATKWHSILPLNKVIKKSIL